MGIYTFLLLLACLIVEKMLKNEILVMAALISILLEMPKGDAMSSSGFSIRTTWATRICKEKTLSVGSRFTPISGLDTRTIRFMLKSNAFLVRLFTRHALTAQRRIGTHFAQNKLQNTSSDARCPTLLKIALSVTHLLHAFSNRIFRTASYVPGLCGFTVELAFACDPKSRGFESRPVRFQVTALGKLLTRMCLCHQAV